MKKYIIVNLVGSMNQKVSLILETDDNFKIKEMVDKAGFSDYKILNDWKIITAKVVTEN